MKILVTGAAGFIGFHLVQRLLSEGHVVAGLDNLNDYYDPELKRARIGQISKDSAFSFETLDIAEQQPLMDVFKRFRPDIVVHLAAQAGVRYSVTNPHVYVRSNVLGFLNIVEGCRNYPVSHLLYASSSSVYGASAQIPFSVQESQNHPLSLYAATKGSNELMAHSYSHLFGIPSTGLRFFTVYGPWGRPDMALFLFTKAAFTGETIDIFNNGEMKRDFTYVDDVVEGIFRLLDKPPKADLEWDYSTMDPASSWAPHRLLNLGNNQPVHLMDFVSAIEKATGKVLNKRFRPMQPGDAPITYADCQFLHKLTDYKPTTSVTDGVRQFVAWYVDYYGVNTKGGFE